MWIVILIIVAITLYELYDHFNDKQKTEKINENAKNRKEKFDAKYNLEKSKIDFPEPSPPIVSLSDRSHYIWKEKGNLYLFPCQWAIYGFLSETAIELTSINIDNIKYFRQKGDLYTKVTGKGGNSSFSPITGPHGKINPIDVKTEVCDNRNTILYYENSPNNDSWLLFNFNDYDTLLKIIPEKDYQVIINKTSNKCDTNNKDTLKELKELFENGLISEEEYQEKKKAILDRI